MKKNGSNKRKQPERKKPVQKASKKNNAEQSEKEKGHNSILKNVSRLTPKQPIKTKPLKEYTRDQLKKQGYTALQAEIIKEGFRVSKNNKVAVNDLKTGRLVWIDASKFKSHTDTFVEKQIEKQEAKKKEYSKLFGTDLKNTSTNVFENIETSQQLAEYLKVGKLRDKKGHFVSNKQKELIIKMFKKNEHKELENFNLNEILKYGKLTKNTVFEISNPRTPKDFFYWNLQHNVSENDFGTPSIKIIDFDGNILYFGNSSAIATSILNKLNKKLDHLEKTIELLENTRAYFTVPVKETTVKGVHTALSIDFSNIKSRLKGDLHNKYRSML